MPKKRTALTSSLICFLVFALFLFAGVVYAATITVDGDGSDWPAGAFLTTDPDEDFSPYESEMSDVSDVYFTNSATDLFWRFDTYSDTIWTDSYVHICMDTDNDTGTGTTASFRCGFQSGVDYYIQITGTTFAGQLSDCTGGSCSPLPGATVEFATSGNVSEIGVGVDDVNATENAIPSTIGFETVRLEMLDTVAVTPSIPGPTAVTVRTSGVESNRASPLTWRTLALLGGTAGIVIVWLRGRRLTE